MVDNFDFGTRVRHTYGLLPLLSRYTTCFGVRFRAGRQKLCDDTFYSIYAYAQSSRTLPNWAQLSSLLFLRYFLISELRRKFLFHKLKDFSFLFVFGYASRFVMNLCEKQLANVIYCLLRLCFMREFFIVTNVIKMLRQINDDRCRKRQRHEENWEMNINKKQRNEVNSPIISTRKKMCSWYTERNNQCRVLQANKSTQSSRETMEFN